MTLNFVCRGSKVSKKDGLTPLELYVIIDGKRRYISLNHRIDPKSLILFRNGIFCFRTNSSVINIFKLTSCTQCRVIFHVITI